MSARPSRLFAVAVLACSTIVIEACANVADLGVTYEGEDGGGIDATTTTAERDGGGPSVVIDASADGAPRQKVRASAISVDARAPITAPPPILHACDPSGDVGPDTGCDTSQGMGCCLSAGGSTCIEQRAAPAACGSVGATVFVACRQSDGDSACCWRTSSNGARSATYAADCTGGAIACLDDTGCPDGQSCHTRECGTPAMTIGECGKDPRCPNDA